VPTEVPTETPTEVTAEETTAPTTEESVQKLPEGLTAGMVVLKANGYNAYVNGQQVRPVNGNTKAAVEDADLLTVLYRALS
jgi:hypothetical protein